MGSAQLAVAPIHQPQADIVPLTLKPSAEPDCCVVRCGLFRYEALPYIPSNRVEAQVVELVGGLGAAQVRALDRTIRLRSTFGKHLSAIAGVLTGMAVAHLLIVAGVF